MCGQVGFMMEAVLPKAQVRKYTDVTTFRLEFQSYKETLIKKQLYGSECYFYFITLHQA